MSRPETAEEELRERIAELERENERLRRGRPAERAAGAPSRGRGAWVRSLASALCIVLATALVPVGVVAGWAKARLVDEAVFVQTFAPLADDPAVQSEVSRQVIGLIEDQVDIDGITNAVFDGIADLGLPDRAASALDLLRAPAASGVRSMLDSGVNDFVRSDLFADAWESSLRVSHRALVATATRDSVAGGAVTISDHGEVAIQLGPIIEQVKASLEQNGFTLAAAIPVVNASISVAQSDALPLISLVYTLTTALGWWLPLVALGLFVLGVLLAVRRPSAIAGSGIGMLVGGAAFLIALAGGSVALQAAAPGMGVSVAAIDAIFGRTVDGMRASSWVLVLLGIVVALLGLSQGRARWAAASRGGLGSLNEGLRVRLAAAGFTTGAFGRWLRSNRALVAILILVLAILALVVLPFATAVVIWVVVVALVVWWLLALCEPPAAEVVQTAEERIAEERVEEGPPA